MKSACTLYVVARDSRGCITHHPIGCALGEADVHAHLTRLAMRKHVVPLAGFTVHSPSQAADAIETLDELGDVRFADSDFDPQWFGPTECLPTVAALLEYRGRAVSAEVRSELLEIHRLLTEASHQRWSFHLVELFSDEEPAIRIMHEKSMTDKARADRQRR